jgi:hypothetical protein
MAGKSLYEATHNQTYLSLERVMLLSLRVCLLSDQSAASDPCDDLRKDINSDLQHAKQNQSSTSELDRLDLECMLRFKLTSLPGFWIYLHFERPLLFSSDLLPQTPILEVLRFFVCIIHKHFGYGNEKRCIFYATRRKFDYHLTRQTVPLSLL